MKFTGNDLRPLFDEWDYEDGKNIRRVSTPEGREVLQVRLPLGIEQYELSGRPDGTCPNELESWYHVYRERADTRPWEFSLEEEDFETLRQECMLYYHRYLLFFQISDYKLCARDTRRNLNVIDFVAEHCDPGLAEKLIQYRPYIIRMNIMARALDGIQEAGDIEFAMSLLEEGIDEIENHPRLENNSIFELEKSRSLRSLRDLNRQLQRHVPKTESQTLTDELNLAVENENYEEAARLRDAIAAALEAEEVAEVGAEAEGMTDLENEEFSWPGKDEPQ